MTHLSRLTLFSTTAISLGGIVFLGSLTREAISGGKETLMGRPGRQSLPRHRVRIFLSATRLLPLSVLGRVDGF